MSTLTIHDDQFLLDGKPFRILAGAMHYFRIPPAYWRDRLLKLHAMGLNTVETYVAWNLHEPKPGVFRFDAGLDLVHYLTLVAELGLHAIVRPGPYICSEWDLGGLPAWLLSDPAMRLRCSHPTYLEAVDRFFDTLLPRLAPLQASHGGPIIAMQVENEYGSYGNDYSYLRHLVERMRTCGIDVLLFTSDGPLGDPAPASTLPGILRTVNFGFGVQAALARLRALQPEGPLMVTEFWNGWFDHWGEVHHSRTPEDAATTLDEILKAGSSVSLYMFHGGTNFGFMNGANSEAGVYQPTVTSYDYDAPLGEAGDTTPKYWAFRSVIGRFAPVPDVAVPDPAPRLAPGLVNLPESVSLFDALDGLSSPVRLAAPQSMEMLGQSFGFTLYRTEVAGPTQRTLAIRGLHDRAQLFLDHQPVGVLERASPGSGVPLTVPPEGATLDILVENMGRINFGPDLLDRKGITGGVLLGEQYLFGWTHFTLPLGDLSGLAFTPSASTGGPAFYRGRFTVTAPGDTFLALPGWTKGVCWINGHNLGRYWNIGPQRTLYVPAPFLLEGDNELIVLELHQTERPTVDFRNGPELGRP
jgi:beta-galactosidase